MLSAFTSSARSTFLTRHVLNGPIYTMSESETAKNGPGHKVDLLEAAGNIEPVT